MAGDDDFELKLDQSSYLRMQANLLLLREGAESVEMQALIRDVAKPVLDEAVRRCPMVTGALRHTGRIEDEHVTGTNRSIRIVFGSDSVDYAVPVHEILHAHHPIGQAKYLESAINDRAAHTQTNFITKLGGWLTRLSGRFKL